jgi:hypothetical protein
MVVYRHLLVLTANDNHLKEHSMKWLDNISLPVLVPVAVLLGLAPFVPEPHLWEKLQMLFAGTLVKPIDIFDLFLHGTPVVLLGMKLLRIGRSK